MTTTPQSEAATAGTTSPPHTALHRDALIIDGLQIANWSPEILRAMHAAGLTAVNCTSCVWEGFAGTMANVAQLRRLIANDPERLLLVHRAGDIELAKRSGRVGIILGFQNLSAIEDQIDRLELFKALGVGVAQIAYNTQNLVGTGCYESRDGGLSDFGRDVIAEMNRVGILADLSHVGAVTSRDVIEASTRPVVFSHTAPSALNRHPRNKTDEEIRAVAERGGLTGVTMFPWLLARGNESTLDDYLDAIEHIANVAGEDHVAIGTDFVDGHGAAFFEWLLRDKGYGRLLVQRPLGELLEVRLPAGLARISDWPNLTAAMEGRGWPHDRIRKIVGTNWLRVLREVWGG
jgi:membrane dipeptidase